MHWTLWILWLAELYRQSGPWHSEWAAVTLVDLWLAAGWQHVFSHLPQVSMPRTLCFWNSTWWWRTMRNRNPQKSAFKQGRWSMSLRKARAVSTSRKHTTKSYMLFVCHKGKQPPAPHSQPSHPLTSFCPELANCYLSPSGGSLWPAVSPVFSHCWFRLGARILPLAGGMSSRLILIIPPHFNGKPARHARFINASCGVLSQLFVLHNGDSERASQHMPIPLKVRIVK